jgi:hypothetical protein
VIEVYAMKKRNREILMQQSLYDLLIKIQDGIESQNAHEEYPCVLSAIEGNMLMKRCEMYGGKCEMCIQNWLNSFPI